MSFQRYDEYKDSGVEWLGDVPAHWVLTPLKRLADIQNGADHKLVEENDGYPVYGSGGVFGFANDYLYDGESVLLGRKGTIDRPLYVSGRFWTVDTMYWTRISLHAHPRFVYYAATTIPFDYYSTSTALPSMTKGTLGMHLVAAPPLHEQTAIAAFLDRETAKIDDLVAEQQNLIALLKEKRQALISHAVTKGLKPNAPMKDSGVEWLGDVPAHWKVMPLKRDLDLLTSGSRGWASNYSDEGALFIRIGNMTRNAINLDLSDVQRVDVPEGAEGERTRVSEGDILFSITAYLGSVAVVPADLETAYVSQHVALARLKRELLDPYWIAFVTLSDVGKRYLASQGYGGTKIQLSLDDIASLVIPTPPLSEQARIASALKTETEKFDALISEAGSTITLLQERRTALISAAVTGKIDVRNVVARMEEVTA